MSIEGSTFFGRMDMLIKQVGEGEVTGTVEFDQAYAHRQHEEMGWMHPHGGMAQYLAIPFFALYPTFMSFLADHLLEEGGAEAGMIEAVELLARESASLAPYELGVLRGSAHPFVTHDGELVYDRPPIYPRLPDEVLDQMHDMVSDSLHPDREGFIAGTTSAAALARILGGHRKEY
jgi:hypothetical protein